jgi:hypothetical protein
LTGNTLQAGVFVATGNVELANAVGGALDGLGGAAKAINGGGINTVDKLHESAYGPLQPNELKDY